ncbi:DUF3465 domain-containing protein [Paralysiella testudinis]|uniref:DUF3465 domain-containing protein n=1 Tax=Paralysiella testudinis TaxID=2809020 RepID=A0A892ZEM3_9NEIS|nr:DUF3465 domain-containing protein [Paralysiella testudinis]QRQ81392.1 DUF3465 domain-containing protein [Paralysiella testudinis]
MRKIPYRSLLIGLLALVAVAGWLREPAPASPQASTSTATPQAPTNTATVAAGNDAVAAAFARQQSNVQLHGQGRVQKTLPDDNQGSRHQRFILKLSPQHTVLVAHNIDLAPRLPGLKKGDEVAFYGVYEYNPQGGVIHWTHHDPAGRHIDGWLEYNGQRYQ